MKKTVPFILVIMVLSIATIGIAVWELRAGSTPVATGDQSVIHAMHSPRNSSGGADPVLAQGAAVKAKQNSSGKSGKKADYPSVPSMTETYAGSAILGRPTDSSIALNIIATKGMEAYVEYGTASGSYPEKTDAYSSQSGDPLDIELDGLSPDTRYYYRVDYRKAGQTAFTSGEEYSFSTARPAGSTFTFAVQGDSHPERTGIMFNPDLYLQTMNNVLMTDPDFYFTIGDDFSIEKLIDQGTLSEETVDQVYLYQRGFLGAVGASAPLFLVNGNHEQAAKYLLDGTPDSAAVLAGNARIKYYPLPAPNGFYSGDTEPVEYVGLPRDYYAFTWGDALFVVLDPYWHSDVPVDNVAGSSDGKRADLWDVTLGEEQYRWLEQTLAGSGAKYKFVFCHHVLGTGRGGIEEAGLYEWGGFDNNGQLEFNQRRAGWDMPIQPLMAKYNVTAFFQGHDHLFACQELDGVVYLSLPCPADDTYTAFNADAYGSGDKLPDSGYVQVTVSPEKVGLEYVRSFLPGAGANGQVAYSREVLA